MSAHRSGPRPRRAAVDVSAAPAGQPPTHRAAAREGLGASLLIMVASWGVGWLPMTPASVFSGSTLLNPLRLGLGAVIVCAVLLAVGAFLLVRAWLRLGRALRDDGADEAAQVQRVTRAAWLWSAPLLLSLPIFSRDVFSYIQQGRLVALGLDPYTDGVSRLQGWFMQGADTIWAESPSPYGPLFLLFAEGTWTVTGGQIEVSVALYRLLALAGMALCLWAVPRLAEETGRSGAWASWLSVANPLFLLYMVAGAHNDALMTGLMLAGVVLLARVRRRRVHALAGVVLVALSVAIKPLTALVLPFVALLLPAGFAPFRHGARRLPRGERWGPWITTAVITLAVLTLLGAGTGLWFGWLGAMMTSGDAAFPYAPVGLVGLALGWLVDLVSPLPARRTASWFYTGMTLAALGFTAWMALRRVPREPLVAGAAVLFVAVVTAPIIQPWYLLWLLPLFACALRPLPRVAAHPRWTGWVTYALVLFLTGVGVVDQISVAQWLPLGVVRAVAGAVTVAACWWLVRRDPSTAPLFPRGPGAPPGEIIEPASPAPVQESP